MSIFSLVNETKIKNESPYWVPYYDKGKYLAREEYLQYFKNATSEAMIVCGECDASFYDSEEFLSPLEDLINDKKIKLYFAFNKNANNL